MFNCQRVVPLQRMTCVRHVLTTQLFWVLEKGGSRVCVCVGVVGRVGGAVWVGTGVG